MEEAMPTESSMKEKIRELIEDLRAKGRPSRDEFEAAADRLCRWKAANNIQGLWERPPVMVTATLDDAMGHGLALIHPYAEAAGLRLHPLGLLQPAETIIAACREVKPAFLGLTVLQFDSEDELEKIGRHLPGGTVVVAGGPVFAADPDLAPGTGVHHVARDAAAFWEILLNYA
jgi:hypothetical protein